MIMVVKNEKGLSSIESIALLVIFSVLIGYGIGYFGVVHTAILNSIHARTYAFETFDNRSDVTYFRSNRGADNTAEGDYYSNYGFRVHGTRTEYYTQGATQWDVTERSISIGRPSGGRLRPNDLGEQIEGPEQRGVNPVWIKVVYGLCINVDCGGAGS